MLYIFAGILVVLWALALKTSFIVHGFIHALLDIAIALVVIQLTEVPFPPLTRSFIMKSVLKTALLGGILFAVPSFADASGMSRNAM
jgi:hypothetical protein